jgi:pyruvate dehydrogenase E1 component alpha subunit
MFAELLGKSTGFCRGKGGSMHIADLESGNLGANAIVGGSLGIATGAAMSAKQRGTDQVAVCFFGEGAINQGLYYEVANMANLWNLPIIYLCENNTYNEYTHYSETTSGTLLSRGEVFGMHSEQIDGQDVTLVYDTARRLIERSRAGEGPALLICDTYRYHGHHVGDINRAYYRTKEEEEMWRTERDPIALLVQKLLELQVAEETLATIEEEVRAEIEEGVEFAAESSYPDVSEVSQHVYA